MTTPIHPIKTRIPHNDANAGAVIKNVFVLMLENRSFDHMLGFSGIGGIDGLTGKESNSYRSGTPSVNYPVTRGADWSMPVGPGHEFVDVVSQLAGGGKSYTKGSPYPTIDNSGFVWDYVCSPSKGEGKAPDNFGEIMKCYDTANQLPVLNALARNFAVCDHWYSSLPGPTWPNRFFVHGASSSGLDDSPSDLQMIEWEKLWGLRYDNGSIFDRLDRVFATRKLQNPWRIYRGVESPWSGSIPGVAALHNIFIDNTIHFEQFDADINNKSGYPYFYTFIEPNYGDIINDSYVGGQSQHPRDDVRNGEALIKSVYESIRNSPLWPNSLLIVTYDEHGGFYDHVAPPKSVPPGDSMKWSQHGFDFTQYGVRVPAIIVSPFTPAGTVDHTLYDHSSVPATLEALVQMANLTARDFAANNVTSLLSLPTARADAPTQLPDPTPGAKAPMAMAAPALSVAASGPVTDANLPVFMFILAKQKAKLDAARLRAAAPRMTEATAPSFASGPAAAADAASAAAAFAQARNAKTAAAAQALVDEVMARMNTEPDTGAKH